MNFLTILFLLASSNSAFSLGYCYSFKVKELSNGIEKIQVSLDPKEAKNKKFSLSILALKTKKEYTDTKFQCEKSGNGAVCTQVEGGGDFIFRPTSNGPVLLLTYLNLKLGSHGTVKYDGKSELDESFAIYKRSPLTPESEDGELEEVEIKGQVSSCENL